MSVLRQAQATHIVMALGVSAASLYCYLYSLSSLLQAPTATTTLCVCTATSSGYTHCHGTRRLCCQSLLLHLLSVSVLQQAQATHIVMALGVSAASLYCYLYFLCLYCDKLRLHTLSWH
ncbi:hypothetical protein J6590_004222 [Homalodisca vitripennis]|nr:hypothetical protein J6590_004222 [Homalodisca vitripennis]